MDSDLLGILVDLAVFEKYKVFLKIESFIVTFGLKCNFWVIVSFVLPWNYVYKGFGYEKTYFGIPLYPYCGIQLMIY